MITFDEYKNTYKGLATEEFFDRAKVEAEAFINARTLGKAEKSSSKLPEVQKALTIYIDTLHTFYLDSQELDRKGVKSESVLSHSITYESFSKSQESANSYKEAEKKCLTVLLPTGLLNTTVKYV